MRDFTLERNESDESDECESTEADGKLQLSDFLSRPAEVHSVGHGIYDGFTSRPTTFRNNELPENPDVQAEPHYYKGAFVVGTLVQWGLVALLASKGFPLVAGAVV